MKKITAKRSKQKPTVESLELRKLYRDGKILRTELEEYHYIRYGFKSKEDFHSKMRKVVMTMIQLGIDCEPTLSTETRIGRVMKLLGCLPNIKLCCACCPENSESQQHLEFMTIDHVNCGGRKHRNENKSGHSDYLLLKQGFKASDYQVICYNCNCSLGHRGYCPHKPEIKRSTKFEHTSKCNEKT